MRVLKSGVCVDAFFQQLEAAASRSLLLDYDGTLAGFCAERKQALPYPQVTELLNRIAEECGTRVAVVSGRRAREVMPLLRLRRPVEVWGAHGHEHLRVDGSCAVTLAARRAQKILESAVHELRREGVSQPLEHKAGAVALHWRGLPGKTAQEVRWCGYRAWLPLTQDPELQLLEFDGGLELRVRHPNKGDTVASLLNGKKSASAYLGDDLSDEDAFAAMAGHGMSVLVRPRLRPTLADLWLRPPAEVVGFLKHWIEVCGRAA